MLLATTALRISEVAGLQVGDVDLDRGPLQVVRQTYPGRGGLVSKQTKGRRRRTVPVIEPLRPTLMRLWPLTDQVLSGCCPDRAAAWSRRRPSVMRPAGTRS